MTIPTTEQIKNRASVRITWGPTKGMTGILMGYNAAYHTVRIGFTNQDGSYSGEKTTVAATSWELIEESDTTNDNAVWAYSNTGTVAHAFLTTDPANGRLRAACRASITREADAILYAAEDVRANGRVCANCEAKWASHIARVEASMTPVTPTGEPTGADPEQPAAAPQIDAAPLLHGNCRHDVFDCFVKTEEPAQPTSSTRPQRTACKTIIKTDTTWTLQSRKDNTDGWSYVSDHASEEAATLRAQAFLIDGSRRHFRVIEHRTEVRATDPIEPPKDTKPQPDGARYVVEPVRLGFAVVDTSTGKPEARMGSRYAANDMASRLNAEKPAG